MSKTVELSAKLSELKRCGEILIGISESLTEMFGSNDDQKEETQPIEKSTKKTDKKAQLNKKVLALEDVRAVLAEKSRNGHTAEVRDLLQKHGADKLSWIDPVEYAALLAEAEVL